MLSAPFIMALRDDKYRSSMTGFAIVPRKPNIPPTCVITASSAIAQNSCMAITIVTASMQTPNTFFI